MRNLFAGQNCNLFLFVPFLLASGAAFYFTMPQEPHMIFTVIITLLACCTIVIKCTPKILRAILIFAFGFCYACIFTHCIDTPILPRNKHNLNITGVVKKLDYTSDKSRIYLSVNAADINAGQGTARLHQLFRIAENSDTIASVLRQSGQPRDRRPTWTHRQSQLHASCCWWSSESSA